MTLGGHDIGVCDWSLRPDGPAGLVANLRELGLEHIQLALSPLLDATPEAKAATIDAIDEAGITVTAGMIGFADENYTTIASIRRTGGFVSPQLWPARRDRALAAARLAAELGIGMISVHAGFIPPSGDPAYGQVVEHMTQLTKDYQALGVALALETGQEKATELLQFLNDLNAPNLFVNFDPANMILYGAGDPVEAIGVLGRHIRHVHVKDATPSTQPGIEWGNEVPFGTGEVAVHQFLRALLDAGYDGPLVIEREAGPNRVADVKKAVETLAAHYGE